MLQDDIFAGESPIAIFRRWMEEAAATEPSDPNAVALATVDHEGMPNVRIVLLKEIGEDGFVFYTNYESTKAQELTANGRAALVCHWKSLRRQVRVRGPVVREDGPLSDAYFASRSLDSRLGAWASRQSRPLDSRETLMAEVARLRDELGEAPPRPPFWGGFRLRPVEIELWADGVHRLHDRFRFTHSGNVWERIRLNP
ncbi:pyridoxamine 5'-phosphate oxidase [Roseitranquillus sediminis]|uniref:pyridoxamine 5'-phosphate oxidase n=1 Tax=Roseitranquillus sediminis TaxID=2809051 RepID=UPI001D0CA46B|nr:pyridoxamine 5'-phosphate oxidase [Roseitranquillus sediminis]MBM9595771.1 pyridoxamine 5'-phosphate oxidase [Roseitranquillus sediminis]